MKGALPESAALVPTPLGAVPHGAATSSADLPSLNSAPQPDAARVQPAASTAEPYLDTEWVAYPTSGPPAISLSLFLGYAQAAGGAAGKLLLDRHGLPSAAQGALTWLSSVPDVPGTVARSGGKALAWVLEPGVTNPTNNSNHSLAGVLVPDNDDAVIAGAQCVAHLGSSLKLWPLVFLLLLSISLLLLDHFNCCGFDVNKWFCNLLGRKAHQAPPPSGLDKDSVPDEDSTGPSSAPSDKPSTKPKPEPTKKKAEEEAAADGEEVDDAPEEIDTAGMLIIGFTVVPALVGDLYFTMLAPFLPGVCHQLGLSSAIVGLIFACQPLGSVFTAPVVPWMLRQPWGDPYRLLRVATSVACIAVSTQGLLGMMPPWDYSFAHTIPL